MLQRILALLLSCCLCLPLSALAEEKDWIAQEGLRLAGQVQELAGSQAWRALMGGNVEINELLDGFASAGQPAEAARYSVSTQQLDALLGDGAAELPEDLLPLARQRMLAAVATQLGATQGAAHVAAQAIAMTSGCLPLPEDWAGGNALALLSCGEDWCALVTWMEQDTGVLTEQAAFLHMSAADAMALLAEMGFQAQ